MALNVGDIMQRLAGSIQGLGGLAVYAYPPDSAQPPFAFVDMPEQIAYDLTMGRGADRTTLKIWVGACAANQMDAQSAALQCAYAAGSGEYSIKAAVESSTLDASVRVSSCEFATIGLSGSTYAGLIFTVDVAA